MSRTFFSLRRRRGYCSRHPAPVTIEDARLVSYPWDLVCVVPSQPLHLHLVATTPIRFLKLSKPCGCTVSTMDLSEARGLLLFRVVRGGIGITQRLGATGTVSSTGVSHTHPRTRASQEPTGHHQRRSPEMEGGSSPETLKRLAILVFLRRSFLPSSKESA